MLGVFDVDKLTEDQFNYFKDIVYAESGIKLSPLKMTLLQSRLMRRLRALGISSFEEYKKYLDNNYDVEITEFINVVTTNKTEFMRESKHFEFMLSTALPKFHSLGRRDLRIWSAASSTGEEPYSIAITCAEFLGNKDLFDCKILATDIDTQVLATGYKGAYPKDTLSVFGKGIVNRHFNKSPEGDQFYTAGDHLKDMISFRRLNLMDERYPMKKTFFIIFCRNVIIYFDRETQKKLFNKIYDYLDDDGFLFIGHSENLNVIDSRFKSVGHTIYVKS
jgi:chemotaxis protein methyltransferase CheR